MKAFKKIKAHLDNIAFSHSIFALPFAYMGAFLAAGKTPLWGDLFWITLAMVGARSAALALNNVIDLEYDRIHPRFTKRPMVTGAVKKEETVILIFVSLIVFWLSAANLAPLCSKLWLPALIPLVIYPYMKRFSWTCHLVLGLALGIAPIGAWVAIRDEISLVSVVLGLVVGVWICGFDIIYGCQDVKFDLAHRLKSIPVRFGEAGALRLAKIMHVFSIIGFLLVGLLSGLGFIYYVGVLLAAIVLIYQHSLVRPGYYANVTQAYFMRNGLVSIFLFIFTLLAQR